MLNISCKQRSPFDFDDYSSYPVYNGDDLEMIYTPSETQFRVWAPTAEAVKVKIYENGIDGETVIEKNEEKPSRYMDYQIRKGYERSFLYLSDKI